MAKYRIKVTVGDVEYHSMDEAAKHFGISAATLKTRKEINGHVVKYEKICVSNSLYDKKIIYNGKEFANAREVAKCLEIQSSMVIYAAKNGKMLFGDWPKFVEE